MNKCKDKNGNEIKVGSLVKRINDDWKNAKRNNIYEVIQIEYGWDDPHIAIKGCSNGAIYDARYFEIVSNYKSHFPKWF